MSIYPISSLAGLAAWFGLAAAALAGLPQEAAPQQQPPPGRVVPESPELDWSKYTNPEAGIELLVPPGKPQASEESNVLHQVFNTQKQWHFELRRILLEQSVNLGPEELPEGGRRAGLLELLADVAQQRWQGAFLCFATTWATCHSCVRLR
jgi:hypothetical protein